MPEAAPSLPILRFGAFELDLRAGELRKQGLKIKLQEKPLQILTLLLESPGEVVTRDQLRLHLWGAETFVDFDHSVNTAVNKLRGALGDSAENPRFIETLPRHGYRFIAPVEPGAPVYDRPSSEIPETEEHRKGTATGQMRMKIVPGRPATDSAPAAAAPPPATLQDRREKGRWLDLIAVSVVAAMVVFGTLLALDVGGLRERFFGPVALPKIESIAVLPLENLSGDPQQEYFADGMTEELITDLSKISALRVISRQSVMRYKDSRKPLPEIAQELHVDAIVEGAVQRSGDRVRITANLLYAPADRHLWAQAYERDLGDVLKLQSEVARAIASQIRIKLTPQEQVRLAGTRPVNPEAYRLYLEGRYYFSKRTLPAFNKSIQLFQRALERDPHSALVYAGLAESYAVLPWFSQVPPRAAYPKAKAAALKALQLDNTLAEAHGAVGYVLMVYDWDWPGAERELKRAIELNPSYVVVHHWYAEYLCAMGRHEQAIAEIRRAQELDPVSPLMRTMVAQQYNFARRYDEAGEQSRKALELDPNFGLAYSWLGWSYFGKGMYKEALVEMEKADRLMGRDPAAEQAFVYAVAGRRSEAVKLLDRLWQQYKRGEIRPLKLARVYAALGNNQRALDLLEEAYEQRDPNMFVLKVPGYWNSLLRSEPRYQAILRRMNFPP